MSPWFQDLRVMSGSSKGALGKAYQIHHDLNRWRLWNSLGSSLVMFLESMIRCLIEGTRLQGIRVIRLPCASCTFYHCILPSFSIVFDITCFADCRPE